jgi:hypothetical protein
VRTAIFLVAGLALLAMCIVGARLLHGRDASALTIATWAFVAIWLAVAGVNLWIGVAKAGYSLREELPIFLLIFLVPAGVALLVRWKMLA